MATYETIFITPPNLAEEDEKTTVEGLTSIITDGGGTISVHDRLGRRRLAYPIKKYEDGVYVRLLYDSEADVPKEIERRIRLTDNVIRVLTVRIEPDWAVAMKEQAVRDEQRRVEMARQAELEAQQAAAEAERAAQEQAAEAASGDSDAASGDGDADAAPTETAEASAEPAADAAPADEKAE